MIKENKNKIYILKEYYEIHKKCQSLEKDIKKLYKISYPEDMYNIFEYFDEDYFNKYNFSTDELFTISEAIDYDMTVEDIKNVIDKGFRNLQLYEALKAVRSKIDISKWNKKLSSQKMSSIVGSKVYQKVDTFPYVKDYDADQMRAIGYILGCKKYKKMVKIIMSKIDKDYSYHRLIYINDALEDGHLNENNINYILSKDISEDNLENIIKIISDKRYKKKETLDKKIALMILKSE